MRKKAHEEAEGLFYETTFNEEVLLHIIRESQDLRQAADQYLQNNLIIQYPEIIKIVQLKLASITLLE